MYQLNHFDEHIGKKKSCKTLIRKKKQQQPIAKFDNTRYFLQPLKVKLYEGSGVCSFHLRTDWPPGEKTDLQLALKWLLECHSLETMG